MTYRYRYGQSQDRREYGGPYVCRCGASTPQYCEDRGGCDEFWAAVREEQRERSSGKPRSYAASQKQINFMRSLVARKVLTDEAIIKLAADIETAIANCSVINGRAVSKVIDHAKTCEDKPREVTPREATVASGEEATPKQKGFIKSLVAKRDVPADVLSQVEEALLSKAKASQLIGLLTTLPMKQNA